MASVVPKLTKNTPSIRTILTTLNTPLFPKPSTSLIPYQTHLDIMKQPAEYARDPVPLLGPSRRADDEAVKTTRFFPSFPFGYCLNPVSPSRFVGVEPDDGDARRIWADSVKKKRKKKINKHKYKKLRKRLRRKARA